MVKRRQKSNPNTQSLKMTCYPTLREPQMSPALFSHRKNNLCCYLLTRVPRHPNVIHGLFTNSGCGRGALPSSVDAEWNSSWRSGRRWYKSIHQQHKYPLSNRKGRQCDYWRSGPPVRCAFVFLSWICGINQMISWLQIHKSIQQQHKSTLILWRNWSFWPQNQWFSF